MLTPAKPPFAWEAIKCWKNSFIACVKRYMSYSGLLEIQFQLGGGAAVERGSVKCMYLLNKCNVTLERVRADRDAFGSVRY